ncbi:MAG TPA: YraN family protein [Bryobacteraceae bacterium]
MIGLLYRAADLLRRRTLAGDHGRLGEDLAYRYLRAHGCTVVARNYAARSGAGEIDLVAWERGVLVFVEVKTRSSADFGAPDAAVDAEKQRRIAIAAREYGRRAQVEAARTRFDIISIMLAGPARVTWRRDAFRVRDI